MRSLKIEFQNRAHAVSVTARYQTVVSLFCALVSLGKTLCILKLRQQSEELPRLKVVLEADTSFCAIDLHALRTYLKAVGKVGDVKLVTMES